MKKKSDKKTADGWATLANAIIVKAAHDYCKSKIALHRNPKNDKAKDMFRDCRHFFKSEYYRVLTTVDGDYMLERLDKKVARLIKEYRL